MVPTTKNRYVLALGILTTSLGLLLTAVWSKLFLSKIHDMLILRNGSWAYETWRDLPVPIYLECFIFNITNADELLAKKNVKLKLQQLGPYVFRERHIKTDIVWNDNSTVTFRHQRSWYFEPEMSNGSLSDDVVTVNPAIASVAYILRNHNIMLRMLADGIIRNRHKSLLYTANVSSWLFEGIPDPVMDLAYKIPYLPFKIPAKKFGWMHTRNGSTVLEGLSVINTGATDYKKLGKIEMWQRSNQTHFRGECGRVQGSNGEVWALEQDQKEIQVYTPVLCTYLTLPKAGPTIVKGVPGIEFAADDSLFDNGHKYPNMACYCDEKRDRDCMPAGILNVSTCHFDAPVFISRPHFLGVDDYYPSKLEGLQPKESYNFGMSIEPVTGIPLQITAQMQVNILVRHVQGVSINNQLLDPDILVPMVWVREQISITQEYANFAKRALDINFGMPYVFYILTIIGVVILLRSLWSCRQTCKSVKENNIEELMKEKFLKDKQHS